MARRRKLGERSVRRCHGLLTAAAEKTMSEVRIEAEIHTRRARRKPTYLPADYVFIKHEFHVELTSDNIQLNISDSEFQDGGNWEAAPMSTFLQLHYCGESWGQWVKSDTQKETKDNFFRTLRSVVNRGKFRAFNF